MTHEQKPGNSRGTNARDRALRVCDIARELLPHAPADYYDQDPAVAVSRAFKRAEKFVDACDDYMNAAENADS